jgi:hypothetical protein
MENTEGLGPNPSSADGRRQNGHCLRPEAELAILIRSEVKLVSPGVVSIGVAITSKE